MSDQPSLTAEGETPSDRQGPVDDDWAGWYYPGEAFAAELREGTTEPVAPVAARIASNIGPDRYWRLRMWSAATGRALGCESATLIGSALVTKDWRDLDVRFSFTDAAWQQMGWAYQGDAWWVHCAALSAHASSVVGAPVDAQVTELLDGFRLWEAQNG